MKQVLVFLIQIIILGYPGATCWAQARPNVILVMTDDQGIGDLGCHGNPWLKTPHIDSLYEASVRLTDFHVSPLCTPTRAALMTGLYPVNNGAWATFKGRDALSSQAITMADVFQQNGYQTAMFGKWHLGDNYPMRPTDCGFDLAIQHHAGGIGELSDYWGNSYFDDVYFVNNEPRAFSGYCTDVWFEEAMSFMDTLQPDKGPFFIYLPTNAPHDPLFVDERYAAPYQHLEGDSIISANLYGMIANIDENIGKLGRFLSQRGLVDNTLLIFMTDNGTRFGYSREGDLGYNKGYRGIKGAKLEGGHRVPFFIHWPAKGITGGIDRNILSAHVDLIPTLMGLCGLEWENQENWDGIDLSSFLLGERETFPDRSVYIHHRQDWRPPHQVRQSCLLYQNWRLINGTFLFDVVQDPEQRVDLREEQLELVSKLLDQNRLFRNRSEIRGEYQEFPSAMLGGAGGEEVVLTIQHAIGEDKGIWKAEQVAAGIRNRNNTHALEIIEAGTYLVSCRRWPKEWPGAIQGIPERHPNHDFDYLPIKPERVRIRIANQMHEKEILPNQESVNFILRLPKGKTLLVNDFVAEGETYGVYYTYISKWVEE